MSFSIRQMFAIDALGALLSAVMLGGVLPLLSFYIGMPNDTLYLLAALAGAFMLYSSSCYFLSLGAVWLMGIALANSAYCLLTLCLLYLHYKQLTTLGLIYFLVEAAVIVGVVYLEVKTYQSSR